MAKWCQISRLSAKVCLVLLLSGPGLHALHAMLHSHSDGRDKPCVVCQLHSLQWVLSSSEPEDFQLILGAFILHYPSPSITLKSSQQAHLPRAPPSFRLA